MKNAVKICALLLAAMVVASCSGVYRSDDADVRYLAVGAGAQKVRLAYRDQGSGGEAAGLPWPQRIPAWYLSPLYPNPNGQIWDSMGYYGRQWSEMDKTGFMTG